MVVSQLSVWGLAASTLIAKPAAISIISSPGLALAWSSAQAKLLTTPLLPQLDWVT
jgi:hypothetical protein